MKLLLADDHGLFREALVQYIQRAEPDADVIVARDIHEVMEIMAAHEAVDLVLLDMRMPGMNGLQGLRKLRETYPRLPIALMSGLAEKADVEEALQIGISGYFPKTLSGKAMMKGLRDIMDGRNFIAMDHNTNSLMPSNFDGIPGKRSDVPQQASAVRIPDNVNLTPREKEVLIFLLRGISNKEIASEMGLQVVTIKLHVRGICRKLGAKNRTQAALIAQDIGFSQEA